MHNAVNERRIMLLLFVIFRIMDRTCITKSFWKSLALGVKEFIWVYRVLNALIRFASMDHFGDVLELFATICCSSWMKPMLLVQMAYAHVAIGHMEFQCDV